MQRMALKCRVFVVAQNMIDVFSFTVVSVLFVWSELLPKAQWGKNVDTFSLGSEGESTSLSEFGTCNLQLWQSWGARQIELIFGFLEMISLVKIRQKQIVEKISKLCFQNHPENVFHFSWSGNCLTTNNSSKSIPGILILPFCQEHGVQEIWPNICNGSIRTVVILWGEWNPWSYTGHYLS